MKNATTGNHIDIFSVFFLVIQRIISGLFTSYWNFLKKKNLTANFTVSVRLLRVSPQKPHLFDFKIGQP